MTVGEVATTLFVAARNELLLFAAVGLLLGGLDDLILDLFYGARRFWRSATVYRRHARMSAVTLPATPHPGTLAIFIPAWDESTVIGPMLRHCIARWSREDVHFFVGVYPNDAASIAIVADIAAGCDRVTMAINPRPGPTTKADCLNGLWRALLRWEAERAVPAKAVVLHDAEDVVHGDAIRVMSAMIDRFALVQVPVLPLRVTESIKARLVSGHYCDEFAESHAKAMLVREALGAALPSAGVGCAIARDMIGRLAEQRGGEPFDAGTLTEDYELGLRIGDMGGRGILVRLRDAQGELVATREYFPDNFADAIKQKARWTMGIALAGWDRLGWGQGWTEAWMRLHDRRALLAAILLASAYLGALLTLLVQGAVLLGMIDPAPLPDMLLILLPLNFALFGWRVMMRMLFVHRAYGPVEALRSVLRLPIANFIAMAAAQRALLSYLRLWAGGALHWDKTQHRFPTLDDAEQA